MKNPWRIILLSTFLNFYVGLAFADIEDFKNRLLFNDPGGGSKPIVWEFDPTSGFTLGQGVDLACLRSDIVFSDDGMLSFAAKRPDEEGCTGTGPMSWTLAENSELGTLGIAISDNGKNCVFAVKFGRSSGSLKLTTSCNQAVGQPRQFRYFPQKPKAVSDE